MVVSKREYAMNVLSIDGVQIDGICSCLPIRSEDNLARCRALYGDEKKALSVVKATGIKSRRIVEPGTSSLDLCVVAARRVMADCSLRTDEIGALVCVTFTPERAMPCNACQAQLRLGIPQNVVAFDLGLACSGYAYGLYVAGLLAKSTGKKVLLLDGDVQTPVTRPDDEATVPVLADAGTATIISPKESPCPWSFAFMSQGAGGEALTCPRGGTISMDGFAVFKFVAMEVSRFIKDFMATTGLTSEDVDAFAPHQANVYMIRQLTKGLKMPESKLWISGDEVGNSASATVPVTISRNAKGGERVLLSGFGGGLSASVGVVDLPVTCKFSACDYTA